MSDLEDRVVTILMQSPADTYTIYKKIGNCNMNELNKILTKLYCRKIICVYDHKKSKRTGLDFPIYCLSPFKSTVQDAQVLNSMVAGMTSERVVEYKFLFRNLSTSRPDQSILDIGTGNSNMVESLKTHSNNEWRIVGIDLVKSTSTNYSNFFIMDGRCMGLASNIFDIVICISTIEHISNPLITKNIAIDMQDELKVLKEISRVLKVGGKLVLTLPFWKTNLMIPQHRVYDTLSLKYLFDNNSFKILKQEFYLFDLKKGIWKKHSMQNYDFNFIPDLFPAYLHSPICLCLLMKKV